MEYVAMPVITVGFITIIVVLMLIRNELKRIADILEEKEENDEE